MDPSTYTKSNFAANSLARKDGIAPKYFGAIFFLKKINRNILVQYFFLKKSIVHTLKIIFYTLHILYE
jgi:hypothetical protein